MTDKPEKCKKCAEYGSEFCKECLKEPDSAPPIEGQTGPRPGY